MRIIEVVILICLAGFFDYMMDGIKDYGKSDKFWFWRKIKGTKYEAWGTYGSQISLWGKYNPAYPWSSDSWHMAKHFMLLSWAGAVAFSFDTTWYFQIVIWWSAYWLEGFIFSEFYDKLK